MTKSMQAPDVRRFRHVDGHWDYAFCFERGTDRAWVEYGGGVRAKVFKDTAPTRDWDQWADRMVREGLWRELTDGK